MSMRISYDFYSDIGGRKQNEDSCCIEVYDKSIVAVLADGLGGQGDGKKASELLCNELIECGSGEEELTPEELQEAVSDANTYLVSQQENSFHMKSTLVYLRISEQSAIWTSVGDSRLYHFYNGDLVHFTLDHSVAQLAVYMGQIERDEIPEYPGRSKLLHALGTPGESADVQPAIELETGQHAFFICSDGVWELLSDEEIEMCLYDAQGDSTEWINAIRALVNERMTEDTDNNSAIAIILNVNEPEPQQKKQSLWRRFLCRKEEE